MEIIIPPKNFVTRAETLYEYGFGFQYLKLNNKFCICYLPNGILSYEDELQLKKDSGCEISYEDYKAAFLNIKWYDYNKIPTIFNTLLKMNIPFITNNEYHVHFDPSKNKEYSEEIEEQLAISHINNHYIKKEKNYILPSRISSIFNWKTQNGKDFCKKFCEKTGNSMIDENHETNYLKWDLFKNYNMFTLMDLPESST